ncbi:MAG TPA: alpha/beta fold hydrolase [Gemmatimonadaceae bacterium]
MPAQYVRIAVPEDRTQGERTITLTALRIPTTAERPGNPIVFLMGGPGIPGTVIAPIPPYFSLFGRLRELADVIIVDQRGIGRSEPVMDCPFTRALPTDFFLSRDRVVNAIRSEVVSCANHIRATSGEPTAYNTIESADDIDDLRKALDVQRVDLLAFSYGTRLALMYAQRHGDHVGRMGLQGVNGPGLVLKRPAPIARKLARISELLRQDTTWRGPTDLVDAARRARERLAHTPATVTIADRRTGQHLSLQIGRDGFDAIASLNLDDVRLPALLISVAANDDRVLARFVESVWNGFAGGTVGLMARAVNCAADRPASRLAVVQAEAAAAPFGVPIDNEFLTDEFCEAVGYTVAPVEFAEAVTGHFPVLMLTGNLDATNPVENAVDVARGLANAVLLNVENGAHEMLPIPVVQDAIVDWFRGADVNGRQIAAVRPRFASIEAASAPLPQRGR